MARYIDADKLLSKVETIELPDPNGGEYHIDIIHAYYVNNAPTANVAPIADTVKKMQESFSNLLEKEYKQYTPDGADHYFKNGSHMMWSIADRVFNQIAKEMLEGSNEVQK